MREGSKSLYDVQVAIRGVHSADETQLAAIQERLEAQYGAKDIAVIYWPTDTELGMQFQIREEVLERLFEPVVASAAA